MNDSMLLDMGVDPEFDHSDDNICAVCGASWDEHRWVEPQSPEDTADPYCQPLPLLRMARNYIQGLELDPDLMYIGSLIVVAIEELEQHSPTPQEQSA